jgi:site-specific recombinase XerD
MAAHPPKLLDRVRARRRMHHAAWSTEQRSVHWIVRSIRFHTLRHPSDLGRADIERFLTHVAVVDHVTASTQHQARSAVLLLDRAVLGGPMEHLTQVVVAQRPRRTPVVLTRDDVHAIFAQRSGVPLRMAQLLDGSGLRLMAWVRRRITAGDVAHHQVTVHDGNGSKDRMTMRPMSLVEPLRAPMQ